MDVDGDQVLPILNHQHGWGLRGLHLTPRDASEPNSAVAIPMRVGASAGSSENYKEGAIFNSGTVRQRLEYTKLWVMWAIIFGFWI
jgi:hypothetical protein